MVQTQEARSVSVTKEDVLRLIVRQTLRPIFRRMYLNREVVIGTIGDRGGGKSGSDAVIATVDYMMNGDTVFSNMNISCAIEVDNTTAMEYGLNSGGVVLYQSQPLEKDALLKLDDRYRNSCLLIEEINVQYSNVRRFMTNTNVEFNEVCQQLRKFKTSLIYNVIDEMFIDPQLRSLTDIFIKTYDTAFDTQALEIQKDTGKDFSWRIYPMTGYLAGEQKKYAVTHRTLPPVLFHFEPWRGIYDSSQHQEKGVYSMSAKDRKKMEMNVSVESDPEMIQEIDEWAWLEDKVRELANGGVKEITSAELWNHLGLYERGLMPQQIGWVLPRFGIVAKGRNGSGKYIVRVRELNKASINIT